MLKRVDVAVFDIVNGVLEDSLTLGKETALGLADNGIDYTLEGSNIAKVSEEIVKELETLKEQIISGEIEVPTEVK